MLTSTAGARHGNAAAGAGEGARRLRVLLVKDDAVIRATTTEILQSLGHGVTAVAGASQALAVLDVGDIDVMMVDAVLPGMSGLAFAEAARVRWPAIGIILATDEGGAVELSGAVMLAKPYDSRAIFEVLNQLAVEA